MDATEFRNYLAILHELTNTLAQLTEIEQKKTMAVRYDELGALNECMRQEQAMTLRLRGLEQKQQAALAALHLANIPLSRLPEHAPEGCLEETREATQALRMQYEQFSAAFEVAQNTLECNLHEIEKILADMGAAPIEGVGYQNESGPELPQKMRTDFRA